MQPYSVLLVDDDKYFLDTHVERLKMRRIKIDGVYSGEAALDFIDKNKVDVVVLEVHMPEMSGIEILKEIKKRYPLIEVIMLTGHASVAAAIESMKLGAFDYITKPFKVDEIKLVIQNALERHSLKKENILLRREIESRAGFENFIGNSAPMQKVFSLINQVAETHSTVLITGESGTGKELVAKAVHKNSERTKGPFVTVNCGALPETLLESELFGYMKGAFTGAVANKQGLFETANGGTIFLDEISATTPALQIKLLRVLQEREFKRVGGTADVKVDVRVIAASNQDLMAEVAKGTFREDLFYRLNVIPISLPPLRDRKEDVPLLMDFFLKRFSDNRGQKGISPEALKRFTDVYGGYRWPGNVRELENMIERMVILASGDIIQPEHVPDITTGTQPCLEAVPSGIPDGGINLESVLGDLEKSLLQKALERAGGIKTEAAKLLGLTFRSFRHRLQKFSGLSGMKKGVCPLTSSPMSTSCFNSPNRIHLRKGCSPVSPPSVPGAPKRSRASWRASRQKDVSIEFDSRHESTYRLNQSMTATR